MREIDGERDGERDKDREKDGDREWREIETMIRWGDVKSLREIAEGQKEKWRQSH